MNLTELREQLATNVEMIDNLTKELKTLERGEEEIRGAQQEATDAEAAMHEAEEKFDSLKSTVETFLSDLSYAIIKLKKHLE